MGLAPMKFGHRQFPVAAIGQRCGFKPFRLSFDATLPFSSAFMYRSAP